MTPIKKSKLDQTKILASLILAFTAAAAHADTCKYQTAPGAPAPSAAAYSAAASESVYSSLVTAPTVKPSSAGMLSLARVNCMLTLTDATGKPVQLRGMSTHGLQWNGGIVNDNAFKALAGDWGSNMVRLALYVGEDGYATKPELLKTVMQGIDAAIANDMYVVVDWHVLSPGDPTAPIYKGAMAFFRAISAKYPNNKHILYELANEPNHDHKPGVSNDRAGWLKVKAYAEPIIKMLRDSGNKNIVVVGTPSWSQRPDLAAVDPIMDANTMYTVHFYTGTHFSSNDPRNRSNVMSNARAALEAGVAVFATEWGTSEASGDRGPFLKEADTWLDFLNKHNISWANWSLAPLVETSAALTGNVAGVSVAASLDPGKDHVWSPTELSASGEYARSRIKGIAFRPVDRTLFSETVARFDGTSLDGWGLNTDSPVKTVKLSNDRGALKLSGMRASADTSTGNYWANVRLSASGLKKPVNIAGAKRLTMDVIVESPTTVSIAAIPQSLTHTWTNPALAVVLKPADFKLGPNGKYVAAVSMTAEETPNLDLVAGGLDMKATTLVDMLLFVGAHGTDSVWLDNISVTGNRSAAAPVVSHAALGAATLPSTFEDGTRQGWTWDGTSGVHGPLLVETVNNAKVLAWDVAYPDLKPEDTWASAPRLVLDVGNMIRGVNSRLTCDFYLKPEQASTGSLHFKVSFSAPVLGYWAQTSEFITIDLNKLKTKTRLADGSYHYKASFDLTKIDDNKVLEPSTRLGKINIIVNDVNSDFAGKMYIDNVMLAP